MGYAAGGLRSDAHRSAAFQTGPSAVFDKVDPHVAEMVCTGLMTA